MSIKNPEEEQGIPLLGCHIGFALQASIDTFASVSGSSNINLVGAAFSAIDEQEVFRQDLNFLSPYLNKVIINNGKLFVSEKYLPVIYQIDKFPDGEVGKEPSGEPYVEINHTGALPVLSGTNSIVIGQETQSASNNSIVIGSELIINNRNLSQNNIYRNINLGISNQIIDGTNVVCLGTENNCGILFDEYGQELEINPGGGSVLLGRNLSSLGYNTINLGQNNSVNKSDSIVIGRYSECLATKSIALGYEAYVESDNDIDSNMVQIGKGYNSKPETIQYLNNTIATADGLFVAETSGVPATVLQNGTPRWDSATGTLYISDGTTWKSLQFA